MGLEGVGALLLKDVCMVYTGAARLVPRVILVMPSRANTTAFVFH